MGAGGSARARWASGFPARPFKSSRLRDITTPRVSFPLSMMSAMPPRALILLLLAAAGAAAGEAAAWCVREGAPADVGVVRVCAPDGAYPQGAAVFAEGGGRVGAQLLWSAPGEPATVLFDASGNAARYRVEPIADEGGWQAQAGVIGESRVRIDGPADTAAQVEELWIKAPAVHRRDVLPHLFWGLNPLADTVGGGFVAEFHAYFRVDQAGEYRFATCSDDASFLSIDGVQVVEGGGWHGVDADRRGEKSAKVQLQPGVHQARYRYVQNGDNPMIILAWQPPGADRLAPMPAEAFAPIATYRVDRVGDGPWFAWTTVDDCSAGGQSLVAVAFTAHVPDGHEARWTFDDGSSAVGATVQHVFARATVADNKRRVRLAAATGGAEVASCERTVLAQPRWQHHERWSDAAHQRLRDALAARDVLSMPAGDVLALVRYADFVGEMAWLERIGVAIAGDAQRWGRDGFPLLAHIGLRLQDDEVRRVDEAAACWRAALAAQPEATAERETIALHLAGLCVHGLDAADEAGRLMAAIDPAKLGEPDRRLLLLYRGDAALASGDAAVARLRYVEASTAVPRGDLHYSVRRRTRIEAARAWVQRGEYDTALQALAEIEWETPLDRLGAETGLLKVRAWLGRKQHRFALACCKRLLTATAADDRRADVLAALAATCLAAGRTDDAAAAVAKLTDEFPYSEAAARGAELLHGGGR